MKLPVKPRLVLGVAAKAALAPLDLMHTRRAAHKAVFVHARFNLLNFHYYKITQIRPKVKRQFVTPPVGTRGAGPSGKICQAEKAGSP